MRNIVAAAAGLALVLAVAGCSSDPGNHATAASSSNGRTATPTPTATPSPVMVVVPDASAGLTSEVTKMDELGLKPVVLDATGADVTYDFLSDDFGSASIFVSQKPEAGTEVEDGATVTVRVRDPKVIVSADFSGPGGSITSLDGSSISQVTDAPQHWEKEVPYGGTTDYTFTNPYAAGTLTCTVTQEGEVVQTNTASGPFASTNC